MCPEGSATARIIGYSLNRWAALTRYIGDVDLRIDSNWEENQIRPIAAGRNNWRFAGSPRGPTSGGDHERRNSAPLNGQAPYTLSA